MRRIVSLPTLPGLATRSNSSRRSGPGGVFYGWVVVASVFTVLMVSSGLGFYNASVILKAAVDELGAPVGVVSFGVTIFFSVSGLTGFALAKLMERIDIRWFFVVAGIVGAVALSSLRWVDAIWKLYLFFGLFGIAFAMGSLVPGTTLVARWFDVKRPLALSIASTGLSLGGIAVTPLIERLIRNQGLAGSGKWMALIWVLGIVPVAVIFIRSRPSDLGLEPDGAPAPPQPRALQGASFVDAIRTRFFRWLCLSYAMIFLAQVGAIAQLFTLVSERVNEDTAAFTLSVMALTSVVGRLAGGVVVLRVGSRRMTIVLAVVQAVALALLATAEERSMIVMAVVLFGVSIGNLLMLQPLLLAEAFGVKEYSRIYSLNQLFGTIGVAGGPFLLGALHDAFSYRAAFLVAAGANIVGFVAILLAGDTSAPRRLWQLIPSA